MKSFYEPSISELIKGAHIGIFVVQRNDKTDIELVVWCVINKPTSLSMIIECLPCCVKQVPLVKFWINAPHFFKTDSIVLRIAVFIQLKRTMIFFPKRLCNLQQKQFALPSIHNPVHVLLWDRHSYQDPCHR